MCVPCVLLLGLASRERSTSFHDLANTRQDGIMATPRTAVHTFTALADPCTETEIVSICILDTFSESAEPASRYDLVHLFLCEGVWGGV